ncbi:unnamed protein product, partial [Closterium sp. NIES-64]
AIFSPLCCLVPLNSTQFPHPCPSPFTLCPSLRTPDFPILSRLSPHPPPCSRQLTDSTDVILKNNTAADVDIKDQCTPLLSPRSPSPALKSQRASRSPPAPPALPPRLPALPPRLPLSPRASALPPAPTALPPRLPRTRTP